MIARHPPARIVVIAGLFGSDQVCVEQNGHAPSAFSSAIGEVEVEQCDQHSTWNRRATQVYGARGSITHCNSICNVIGKFEPSVRVELERLIGRSTLFQLR